MKSNMRVQTLDKPNKTVQIVTTAEVAKIVGLSMATLERWLAEGKIAKPKVLKVGGKAFRNWKRSDISQLKKYKLANYRKGRGRGRK